MNPSELHDYSDVRGPHYQADDYQHWDLVEDIGLNYHEGCATKYLARYNKPTGQGLKDLKKSHTYVSKLIAIRTKELAGAGPLVWPYLGGKIPASRVGHHCLVKLNKFFDRHDITNQLQRTTIAQVCRWQDVADLRSALLGIQSLIALHTAEAEREGEATPAYVNQD